MWMLFRNPVLRLLGALWWLPALLILTACCLGGAEGLRYIGVAYALCGTAVAGMVGAAAAHAGLLSLRARIARLRRSHRFLCPECLRFAPMRVACGTCGKEISLLFFDAGGLYLGECPGCGLALAVTSAAASAATAPRRCLRSSCWYCRRRFDLALNRRRVRVLATLLPRGFDRLLERAGGAAVHTRGRRHFHIDDGETLTHVVDLNDLPRFRFLSSAHAVHEVEAIWVDAGAVDVLALGRSADRFLRRTDLPPPRRQAITVCLDGELPPAVHALLASRFGRVRTEVTAHQFLAGGACRLAAGRRMPEQLPTAGGGEEWT